MPNPYRLRHLYDGPDTATSSGSLRLPLPLGEGWGEGPAINTQEEAPEEDDDPW